MSQSISGTKNNSRFEVLDIMKGILIVLVVLGHTNTSLTKWIYSFHMAAFFAISGYLWNEKHAKTSKSSFDFVISRLKRLYVPFVAVNVVYILLNNVFVRIGFYTTDSSFLGMTETWPVRQSMGSVYGIRQIVVACIKSLGLMSGSAPLVNTCWFLSTLLIVTLIHLGLCLLTKKTDVKRKTIIYSVLLIANLVIAQLNTSSAINFRGGVQRIFPAYAAFLLGAIVKLHPIILSKVKAWMLCVIAVCGGAFVLFNDGMVEISKGNIVSCHYFVVGLLHGISIVLLASKILKGSTLGSIIKYLGRKSMSIMLFHFTAFKLVTFLLIVLYGLKPVYLASFHMIYEVSPWWSLLYLAVGLCVPLAVDCAIDRIKMRGRA